MIFFDVNSFHCVSVIDLFRFVHRPSSMNQAAVGLDFFRPGGSSVCKQIVCLCDS